MSHRLRLALAILGLIVLLVAIAAIVYVAWPMQTAREQLPVAPTLFAPPATAVEGLWWL